MKKIILATVLVGFISAGCTRHESAPDEIVDESYLHRYGVQIRKEDWSAQGQTGKVVSTLKSGVVVTKEYVGGVLDGETTYTYPHSDLIESKEQYSHGRVVARQSFYRNGAKSSSTNYTTPSQRQVTLYYDNGTTAGIENYDGEYLASGEYYNITGNLESKVENGKGSRTSRDPFGNLLGVDTITDGAVTLTRTFYPSGSVQQSIPYVNGQIHGEVRSFLPGGEPSSVEVWVNGEKTGTAVLFENGEKVATIQYTRGIKDGIERRYRDGDTVVEEIHWVQDVRHGPSITKIHGITKTDYYLQGVAVSQSTFEKMTNGITPNTGR